MRKREPRQKVTIGARMRTLQGWAPVAIRNVSRHGMLLHADPPPQPGSYLEVRRNRVVIVARAVWREGNLFGVRAQDPIDIAALQNGESAAPREVDGKLVERRQVRRDPAAAEERAARTGRWTQFMALAVAVGGAAALAADAVWSVLGAPLARAGSALADAAG